MPETSFDLIVVGAGIVGLAHALDSSGLAIGSQGLTAAESLFMGSVAYKILHLARGPTLVVR